MFVTPEELLAGNQATYDVEIPAPLLRPHMEGRVDSPGRADSPMSGGQDAPTPGARVRLRPLTVRDVQVITKAAKDDDVLTSILMIQRALVEPAVKQNQVADMPGGLVAFLVERINRISGLTTTDDQLQALRDSPLVQAFFVLAREFNWTPQQVRAMTVGQILGYLEMLSTRAGRAS